MNNDVDIQLEPDFILDTISDSMSDWHTMGDLAEEFNVTFEVVDKWLTQKAVLSDYEHVREVRKNGVMIFIHTASWEQLCQDFWFRNVNSKTI